MTRTPHHLTTQRAWRVQDYSVLIQPRMLVVLLVLLAVLLILVAAALSVGRTGMSLPRLLQVLFEPQVARAGEQMVLDVRLPRVLTACFVGVALGVSGAVFQSITRNPLGSPDVIGFTTGAATGALLQIVLYGQSALGVAMGAMMGGLVAAMVVYLLSLRNGKAGGRRLVLVGIGVGAVLHALNGLMLVKGELDNAVMANLWLAGTLNARSWSHAWLAISGVVLFVPFVLLSARRLAMMEMGDEVASQLGIPVERVRLAMVFCAVMLAALATGAAGPVAFIALAAPQLARRLGRARGLPVAGAALMGACLLVGADLLSQWQPLRLNLPVGKVTGMLGGLYLIWLLAASSRRGRFSGSQT
ncbi:FecCD family ABC transporter permease [Bordetella genomosp. 4]|uniref:ABC transporter permease n=1 Tax=Bordetella genomosp. 4 TaxID=463044 RepID=A0A261UCI4_9BORD|nr:iron chelate uptake ABC transporter family permease subunit [Bordetella genomosp. 4]OZI59217.1 ABC transporter permease [Bordetella genomosp. 4]